MYECVYIARVSFMRAMQTVPLKATTPSTQSHHLVGQHITAHHANAYSTLCKTNNQWSPGRDGVLVGATQWASYQAISY